MKKIIFLLIFIKISLLAELTTILPFVGNISYSDKASESLKKTSRLAGIYVSTGNYSYLLEGSYSSIQTNYKSAAETGNTEELSDLIQDEIYLSYSKYDESMMYKFGAHYISTNDVVLNDAIVAIFGFGGYKYIGYDKYSYGVNGYYSFYKNGRKETDSIDITSTTNIGIVQISPYFSYFNSISYTMSNLISLEFNYQNAPNYNQKEYISYSISNTFYYKSFFTELSAYNGEMRSGVKAGGNTVINTLDLQKYGAKIALGYYLSKDLIFNISYSINDYIEYSLIDEALYDIAVAKLSYRF